MSGKNKHFTYEDRVVIQQSLKEKLSFKEIGKLVYIQNAFLDINIEKVAYY